MACFGLIYNEFKINQIFVLTSAGKLLLLLDFSCNDHFLKTYHGFRAIA